MTGRMQLAKMNFQKPQYKVQRVNCVRNEDESGKYGTEKGLVEKLMTEF